MEDTTLRTNVQNVSLESARDKSAIIDELIEIAKSVGMSIADVNTDKPWGGFVRFDTKDSALFVRTFFPGLSLDEARLGNPDNELSPKFLLVAPGQRLSWQRHARRAERWAYLNEGGYYKSTDPENPGEEVRADAGEVVQFQKGECHRLTATSSDAYTLVAEIWQHTDPAQLSDEDDIERIADDYSR